LASAIVACVPDPSTFGRGRSLSAWIGLTPRQNSGQPGCPMQEQRQGCREALAVITLMTEFLHSPSGSGWLWVSVSVLPLHCIILVAEVLCCAAAADGSWA